MNENDNDIDNGIVNENKAAMSKKEERHEIAAALGLVSQLGISMFICLFIGIMAGKTLDNWLGTSPLLLAICTFIGAVASFKVLYDLVIKRWMK